MVASTGLSSACVHAQPSPLLPLHFCTVLSASTQHLSCRTPTLNGPRTGLCSGTTAFCLGCIQNPRLGYMLSAAVSRLDHSHRNSTLLCVPLLVGPPLSTAPFLLLSSGASFPLLPANFFLLLYNPFKELYQHWAVPHHWGSICFQGRGKDLPGRAGGR